MPDTIAEAVRVSRQYESLNGRYYFVANILLEEGRFLEAVTFDGDSRVAVEYGGHPLSQQPDLIAKPVVAYLVTRDRSAGQNFGDADEVQRQRFAKEHDG